MTKKFMSHEALIKMFEENADQAKRIMGPEVFMVRWPEEERRAGGWEIWEIGSHHYWVHRMEKKSSDEQGHRFSALISQENGLRFFTNSAEGADLSFDDFVQG